MKLNLFALSIILIGFLTISCGDDDPIADNAAQIQEYIALNNLDAKEVNNSGLYYVVTKEGNGEFPTINNEVTVHYEGRLLDGSIFDSSIARGTPISIGLNSVITGWQIGIPQFSKGGAGILIIPSDLGYQARGQGAVPGNAVMVFNVELIDFK